MRLARGTRGSRRLLLALAAALALLLVLAQLLLPRLAADRISSRVGRYGAVNSVSVSAWPAIELLWGHADSVQVGAAHLALEPGQAATLLSEASGVARMDLRAQSVAIGKLALTDATLRKRGAQLQASALVTEAAAQAALPAGLEDVRLLRSEQGAVEVQVRGSLFGFGASVDVLAQPREGELIAHPLGLLAGALTLTVFSSPHVYVEAVAASPQPTQPPSYRLAISARLR